MRIGGIGLNWTHPEVERIEIHPSMTVMDYDGLIINAAVWFGVVAQTIIGESFWDGGGGLETSYQRGQALKSVLTQFSDQVAELCRHCGVVVVLADQTATVRYSLEDPQRQRLNAALNIEGQYSYLTSMTAFFGAPFDQLGRVRWRQVPRTGHGSPAIIRRTVWDDYLSEKLEWRAVLNVIPALLTPIATAPVREKPSDDVVAGVIGTESIAILPHPSDVQAEQCLIDCIGHCLSGPVRPDWVNGVNIPAIDSLNQEIFKYQDKIAKLEREIASLEPFKDLLFETGGALEDIVGVAFQVLGLNPRKPDTKGEADWLIDLPGGVLGVCEVTGSDSAIPKKKATQLLDWKNRYDNCKAILVGNPLRMEEPTLRFHKPGMELISPHAVQVCQQNAMAIMFTQTLFEAVCARLEGEDAGVTLADAISRSNGVVEM